MSNYPKMDPKAKKKWLKALRSGEFCQTTDTLVDETGYCCLGVLAEVCGKKTDWEFNAYTKVYLFQGKRTALRSGVFGLSTNVHDRLTAMNDDDHASFEEIADWIEENL